MPLRKKDLKWLEGLPADDLPEPFAEMVRVAGVGSVMDLAQALGGSVLYLPKPDVLRRMVRDKKIFNEFNGKNSRQIARKYGISERHVKRIVKKQKTAKPHQ
jgi:Mor family transcriptional regulator